MLDELLIDKLECGDYWTWTGYRSPDGYGRIKRNGRSQMTHRYVWEQLVGPVAHGMELHHQCLNRACCNPDHLEEVTHAQNMQHTVRHQYRCGHPRTEANSTPSGGTGMQCRQCKLEGMRRYGRSRNRSME